MTFNKQLLKILPLIIIVAGLFAYNFMSAQWTGPGQNPPQLNTPAPVNIGGIYQAKTGDLGAVRMRAGSYCNADGTICTTADELGGGGGGGNTITVGGRCFEPALMVTCMWNWSGDGNDQSNFITYNLSNPQSACSGSHSSYYRHSMILAQCQAAIVYTYAWQTGAWGYCSDGGNCTGNGTQSRGVSCRRSDGITVANSFCTGAAPATRQGCRAYVGGSCR